MLTEKNVPVHFPLKYLFAMAIIACYYYDYQGLVYFAMYFIIVYYCYKNVPRFEPR